MKSVRPFVVGVQVDATRTMVVLDRECDVAGTLEEITSRPADITLIRSSDVHSRDVFGPTRADELAEGTSILTQDGRLLRCWGLPSSTPVQLDLEERLTLRLNLMSSPFGYRPVAIDLTLDRGRLLTQVACGHADLQVDADWTTALTWLTQPDQLFADAFPGAVRIRGEIAVLSLFEGVLWRATADQDPSTCPAVVRWSQLWPTGRTRRELRATSPVGPLPPKLGTA